MGKKCWNCHTYSETVTSPISGIQYCVSCGASQETCISDRAIIEFIADTLYAEREGRSCS